VLVYGEKFYSTLRSRTAKVLDEHCWLAPAATTGSFVALVAASAFQLHVLITLGAAGCLLVTAFVWGYSTRRLRVPQWPTLAHLNRRQYAETWDTMASSLRTARIAVSGKAWEWELHNSTAVPIRNLVELVSVGPQDDVLEIACGIGRIGLELSSRCHSWTGADISANMLTYAAQRLQGVSNVRLQQLDGKGLSGLADNSFDVVYCTNTIAHLDELDRWRYVLEAFRVLRPGGRIFIDNIDVASDEGWASFLKLVEKYQDAELPPYMPRFSNASELVEYATRAGFKQVRSHPKPPLIVVTAVKPDRLGGGD
jgi:ubiquinone/menaquinone biosynthesis C-methylase UbiE